MNGKLKYTYVCRSCGNRHDALQSVKDPIKRKCPACGRMELYRELGNTSQFVLRGDNWQQAEKLGY